MQFCLLGNIVTVHGIGGGVRVQSFSDVPGRFSALHDVLVGLSADEAKTMTVRKTVERGKDVLLFFDGVKTRDEAEHFIGSKVFIRDEQMAQPPQGKTWVHDLIGCAVLDRVGTRIGTLTDVYLMPAQDLYLIDCNGRDVLIPAVAQYIASVDVPARTVTVNDISGLLEDADEN